MEASWKAQCDGIAIGMPGVRALIKQTLAEVVLDCS